MWRCDNVGGLGEHVKKHVLWFLRYTFFNFFALFFGSRRARKCGPILTIYTSYDVFPPNNNNNNNTICIAPIKSEDTDTEALERMCLLGVSFILLFILGAKSPKNPNFGGVNRHFQA